MDSTEAILITGEAADFGAAMDEVVASATDATGRIEATFSSVGDTADAAAGDISSRLDEAFAGTATAAEAAAARIDEALQSTTAAAAESSAKMAASGDEAAAAMAAGMTTGAEDVETAARSAGEDAGAALTDGTVAGSAGMADELAGAGVLAGQGAREGVAEGASGLEDDLGAAGAAGGEKLAEGAEGGGEKVKGMLSNLGVPSELVEGWAGLAVGIGAIGAIGLDMAEKMQTADTAIANSAGISTKAATDIGNAFLGTATQTEFSGEEMATAFSQVAGQLKSTQGSALTTAQSLTFMNAASDLATSKQISLGSATSTLAGVMQAFQLSTRTAATASDILFESANSTGQSITLVGQALDKVKTKLGGLAPSLSTLSGLLVDMTNHGETGRAAMSSLTTAFTAFLKPAATVAKAQTDMNVAMKDLTPTLQGYAEAVKNGSMSVTQLTKVSKNLTTRQRTLLGQFTSAYTASITASEGYQRMGINALQATGKLRPLKTIIGQLHTQIAGMSTAQATAQLTADGFGSSASKLVAVIQGGTGAFDKATDSVTKMGSAHAAAAREADTMGVMFKTVKAAVEDWVTELGQKLMPVLQIAEHAFIGVLHGIQDLIGGIADVIDWFKKASPAALAAASVLGVVLMPAIVSLGTTLATTVGDMAVKLGTMASEYATNAASSAASFLGIGTAAEAAEATTDTAMETMAATTDAAAEATDTALGSTGVGAILIAVGIAATLLMTHWKTVWGTIKAVAEDVWHALDATWHAIESAIKAVWDDIKSFLHSTIGQIVLFIVNPIAGLVNLLAQHWQTIESGAKAVWNDIVNFFTAIPGRIVGAITSLISDLENIASEAWHGFATAAQDAWNLVYEWFIGIPAKVLGVFKDAGTWLFDVGKQILEGLLHGVTSAVGDVVNGIKHIGGTVVDAFKDVFSIFSPSQVMADEVGLPIAQGIAKGILDGQGEVTSAINTLANLGTFHATSSVAALAAAGGTVNPAAINGGAAAAGGTVRQEIHIHIDARGALTDPQELANELMPGIRSALLQTKRSMGGTVRNPSGLALA